MLGAAPLTDVAEQCGAVVGGKKEVTRGQLQALQSTAVRRRGRRRRRLVQHHQVDLTPHNFVLFQLIVFMKVHSAFIKVAIGF